MTYAIRAEVASASREDLRWVDTTLNGFLPIVASFPILACLTTPPDSNMVRLYEGRLSLARRGGTIAPIRLSGSGLSHIESHITNTGMPNHHDKPHDKLDQSNTAYSSNDQRPEIHSFHGGPPFAVKNSIILSPSRCGKRTSTECQNSAKIHWCLDGKLLHNVVDLGFVGTFRARNINQ